MTTRGPIALTLCLAAAMVLVGTGMAADYERATQRPDEFLTAWVRGVVEFDWDREYHEKFPETPHKRASELYEVAVKAFSLRGECGEKRAVTLSTELLELYRTDGTDEPTRGRILHVLGRLRSRSGIGLLCEVASTGEKAHKCVAIESLGFFGNAPSEVLFSIFGGRLRKVVFPPSPDARATATLLSLVNQRVPGRWEVRQALESHRGPEVANLVFGMLTEKSPAQARWSLRDILVRNLDHLEVRELAALLTDERKSVRRTVAHALGWSAKPEAVAPLLGRLDEEVREVREEVYHALGRLAGLWPRDLDLAEMNSPDEWVALLGNDGEKFDRAKALRHEDQKPGIYRIGR